MTQQSQFFSTQLLAGVVLGIVATNLIRSFFYSRKSNCDESTTPMLASTNNRAESSSMPSDSARTSRSSSHQPSDRPHSDAMDAPSPNPKSSHPKSILSHINAKSHIQPADSSTTGRLHDSVKEMNKDLDQFKGSAPWKSSDGEIVFNFEGCDVVKSSVSIESVYVLHVPKLQDMYPHLNANIPNTRMSSGIAPSTSNVSNSSEATPSDHEEGSSRVPFFNIVKDEQEALILADIVRNNKQKPASRAFVRGGPRSTLFFHPETIKAALVTCGGLCPGLNNVVKGIVEILIGTYGVRDIIGIQNGYWGFYPDGKDSNTPRRPPIQLTLESVRGIQHKGGSILGSARGGCDPQIVVDFCQQRGINQLYVIGGNIAFVGAERIVDEAKKRNYCLAITCVPKTIDNDIALIDNSFGFHTAIAEASKVITSAKIEAMGAPYGIGVVKLMGRFAGFISAHATMATGDVDLCLLPEYPFMIGGDKCMFRHIEKVLQRKGHAVIVVSEGAGYEHLAEELKNRLQKEHKSLPASAGGGKPIQAQCTTSFPVSDDSTLHSDQIPDSIITGATTITTLNRTYPASPTVCRDENQPDTIDRWLLANLKKYLLEREISPTFKYMDPSYIIRAMPADAEDAVQCTILSQAAVHGVMAGFTEFAVGLVNNRIGYLPLPAIINNGPRVLARKGRTYDRILEITRQPSQVPN